MSDRTLDDVETQKLAHKVCHNIYPDGYGSKELNGAIRIIREVLALRDAGEAKPFCWLRRGDGEEWLLCDKPRDDAIPLYAAPISLHAVTVERCAKVCEDEKVDADGTRQPEDYAYNKACDHCAAAILQLAPETGMVSVPDWLTLVPKELSASQQVTFRALLRRYTTNAIYSAGELWKQTIKELAAASGEKE